MNKDNNWKKEKISVKCICKNYIWEGTYEEYENNKEKYKNCPVCGYTSFYSEIENIKEKEKFKNSIKKKIENKEKIEAIYKQTLENIKEEVMTDLLLKKEDDASEKIAIYIENNYFIKSTRDDLKSEIWFYSGGVYKPNGETRIQEITRQILGKVYTPQRVNKVIAKISADTKINVDKFFNNDNMDEIPVKNGILNLNTLELNGFTPQKIFFNKINAEYNPEAKCPNISKFFNDILKEQDDYLVIEELFGYCLHKDHFIEKAVMMVGDGRNGKGKCISLIKKLLGSENCCSVTLSQLTPQSTSVCELHGKLANLAGDLSNTSLKDTGLFKEITGRDMVGAKRKYLTDLFFVNYSKQIFACNQLPKVYDESDGFWERWILLEFPYKFIPKSEYDKLDEKSKSKCKIRDVDIIQNITTDEEMSGLLNLAIEGLNRLKKNKDFSYTKGTKAIKDTWIRRSDSFHAFCIDNIKEDYEGYVPKKMIRKLFSDYCKQHKIKGASDKAIKSRLEDLYGATDEQIDLRIYGYGNWESCWSGIKIKNGVTFKKDEDTFVTSEDW